MNDSYKAVKEAFVSNLKGTSISEIILVTLPLPAALWAYAEIKALRQLHAQPAPTALPACFYEYVLLILPVVLAQTFPAYTPLLILFLLLVGGVCRSLTEAASDPPLKSKWQHDRISQLLSNNHRNYLTNYRAGIMLTSAVAILAVDFPIFPRRFAKTEAFGTGLMDLGVGCFIFSSGVSSAAARSYNAVVATPPLEPARRVGFLRFLWRVVARCIPLVVLGGSRLVLQRWVDYQEHVSEYGVHWNFFLTLACVQALGPMLHFIVPHRALLPLSIIIMAIYQMHLSLGTLTVYILNAPRQPGDFISQNREGVFGVAGYLGLYLLGEQVGTSAIWRRYPPASAGGPVRGPKWAEGEMRKSLLKLVVIDAVLWLAMYAASETIQPISRRLVNLPYVLWAAAHNVMVLALLLVIDGFASIPATTRILEAVNRNQLVFFLVANLVTGLVNLCMQTIYAPAKTAMTVVLGYMLLLMVSFVMLDRRLTPLKFW